jgi:hypothetical protein
MTQRSLDGRPVVHAFSAAVCLGAICIDAPASAFAAPAYMSLVTACDLAQAATEGSKAKGGLVSVYFIRGTPMADCRPDSACPAASTTAS